MYSPSVAAENLVSSASKAAEMFAGFLHTRTCWLAELLKQFDFSDQGQ
jgi:hypothetical protein